MGDGMVEFLIFWVLEIEEIFCYVELFWKLVCKVIEVGKN